MNWDDLRYVLAVARQRTLAAAGRELGVDSTTVGRRILAIETQLGARLFERTGEGFAATHTGEIARARAEEIELQTLACVYSPDGKPITIPSNGSGTFQTREDGEKVFTNKVDINYEQGKRTPVSFDWKPEAGKYQTGDYKIEIYQNGYKIGEGTKSLKKGGLFG